MSGNGRHKRNTLGYNCWWGRERGVSWILLRHLCEYLLKASREIILLSYMLFFSQDFKLNPFCPEITPPPNPAFLFHTFSPKIELYIAEGDQLCQLHHLHLHSYPRRSLGGDNQIFASYLFAPTIVMNNTNIKRWWEMVVFTISIIMDYGSCGI